MNEPAASFSGLDSFYLGVRHLHGKAQGANGPLNLGFGATGVLYRGGRPTALGGHLITSLITD